MRIDEIIDAIRMLTMLPEKRARQIGFRPSTASKPKLLEPGKSAGANRT
jgi:hypothetical protein